MLAYVTGEFVLAVVPEALVLAAASQLLLLLHAGAALVLKPLKKGCISQHELSLCELLEAGL